jgi:hypothetical protein
MRPLFNFYDRCSPQFGASARISWANFPSDTPIISWGTFLDRGDYFVAVAASCGRWRVEDRESRYARIRAYAEMADRRDRGIWRVRHAVLSGTALAPILSGAPAADGERVIVWQIAGIRLF